MDTIQTINPTTENVIASYPLRNAREVDHIIKTMRTAHDHWKQTPLKERIQLLVRFEHILNTKKRSLAKLMTEEMGKPIQQSLAEIEKCIVLCRYYAEKAEEFLNIGLIQTEFYKSYRTFQPYGIILAIMPWNFPFWQVLRFAVPNLILGNSILLKHAPNTSGCALCLEKLFLEASFPDNIFRSLIIDVDLVPAIIKNPAIAGVTFTGSQKTGQTIAKEAGAALKKVALELGGNDPFVVLADADLELAAKACVQSRLNNAGQVCIAAKRTIVVKEAAQPFIDLVLKKAQDYNVGDPNDMKTQLGPMARQDLRDKFDHQVQQCISSGAECILGGKPLTTTGYFYPPTLLLHVSENSPAFKEELFGPAICLSIAKDETDAMRLANHSTFGLAGAIFTNNLSHGEKLAKDYLEGGICAVNSFVASDPRLPFGGTKQSGFGRELSLEGMHEFANIKTIIIHDTKNTI